jgi:hypothetical protein
VGAYHGFDVAAGVDSIRDARANADPSTAAPRPSAALYEATKAPNPSPVRSSATVVPSLVGEIAVAVNQPAGREGVLRLHDECSALLST